MSSITIDLPEDLEDILTMSAARRGVSREEQLLWITERYCRAARPHPLPEDIAFKALPRPDGLWHVVEIVSGRVHPHGHATREGAERHAAQLNEDQASPPPLL
jgi:hypothetical protein